MAWLYIPLLVIAVVYALYAYFTRTFDYWKKRNVAYPKPLPFFGNLKDFNLRKVYLGELNKRFYNQFPNEKIVGIFRMTTPAILIRDLDLIKHIMIKDFDAFLDRGYRLGNETLGANLFHADGETWQVLRNRFTPIFTSGKLRNMTYLLTDRADKFIDHVANLIRENPELETRSLLQQYTLTTISACAFGLDVDLGEEQVKLLKSFDERIFSAPYVRELNMMYPRVLRALKLSIFGPELRNFFRTLVKDIVRERKGMPSGRKDFMDLILDLRQQHHITGLRRNTDKEELHLELSEDVISAQAFVFYAAGYETSASTMSFMMYELAKNPDIQDKLIAEVDQVLKNNDGKITYDCLKNLTYMEQVMNETLRMYPIVDVLQRMASMDYKIPDTDVVIKKGQMVIISPLSIHHDPAYYPNPSKFDPERFSPENINNLHPCAHIPFGIGPRNCIGMRFAKIQSRACMVKFFSKFRVEVSKNTPETVIYDPTRLIITPIKGLPVNIVLRS